jgi:hypothetical protein
MSRRLRAAHDAAARSDAEIAHPLTQEEGATRFYHDGSGRVIDVGSCA